MRSSPNRLAVLAVLVFGVHLTAQAPQETIDRIVAEGRGASQVMRHLDHLVNKIGPRLTSSTNLTTACEWAVETFKSFGIENAHMEEWGEFPVGFDRGVMMGRMVAPKDMILDITTMAWSPGTKGLSRGRVVLAPEDAASLDAEKVKGAWVLVAQQQRRGAGGNNDLSAALEKAGALGELRPGFGATNDLVITAGNSRVSWDELPTFPRITLRRDQITEIRELMDQQQEVVLEFDIENRFVEGPIKLYNVIADIKGTEFPDEYVIVGGHIDSWDGARGTTDNGTGVATTLEAARLLTASGARPRRSIRFMLWSGEEQGLLGSKAWIAKNADMLPKISAVLVHDGGTNYVSGIISTLAMADDFKAVFAPCQALDPTNFPFEIRVQPGLPSGIGSDHDSFLQSGVPGFFWNQAGRANYTHTHHTQFDTFDAAIPEYQQHTSMIVAIGALGVADLDHMLSRENLKAATTRFRRRIGLSLDEDNKVSSVVEDGIAGRAGMKVGDKLLVVGTKEIKSLADLREALNVKETKVKFAYEREGKRLEGEFVFPAEDQ